MIDYIGLNGGTLLRPAQKLRATFRQTLVGAIVQGEPLDNIRGAYDDLQTEGPASGYYVVSPLNAGPGDKAFTVDIRLAQSATNLGAATLAASLNYTMPAGWDLIRLELVQMGEGSAAASENREEAAQTVAAKPPEGGPLAWLSDLYAKLQSFGKWFIALVVAVALILAVYFFRK
jgi:hypothetical protein